MEADAESLQSNHWDILAGGWKRIAILGVGNELNGDDGAGVQVARALKGMIEEHDRITPNDPAPEPELPEREGDPRSIQVRASAPAVLILEVGPAPENFTGPLRRFRPDLVLFVDAADVNLPPGSVAWLDWSHTDGLSASTHTLPPSVLGEFLLSELGCRLVLVGIQPQRLDFDAPLSEPVQQAVNRTSRELAAWLSA